ncbi:MAG TPA: response regulator [Herpetosiphonaceae bacterium]
MDSPQPVNVFVIEDNADNLYVTQRLLNKAVKVDFCNARASGAMFFQWLHRSETTKLNPKLRELDLILLDIQIPREDGYTILRQIRQTPELNSTKVIAVTSNVMPDDVVRAREAGFDGFIGKPLDTERFPEQIRRILAGEAVWEPR